MGSIFYVGNQWTIFIAFPKASVNSYALLNGFRKEKRLLWLGVQEAGSSVTRK
jgi:hypothetical protein